MIKRIIACLSICLIITGLISPVYSHAEPIPIYTPNWNDPGIAEIINISDLTGWMANGGVYDITSFQDLDEFLTWYFKIRVPVQDEDGNITFAPTYGYDTYLDSNYSSPRFIEQSNIRGMIARSYQNKTGYGRRLQEQVDKALIEDGSLSDVNIPLLNLSESAYFVGYNNNAINYYKDIFDLGNDIPDPNPDPNYLTYIDIINGNGYYNWTNLGNPTLQTGTYTGYSTYNHSWDEVSIININHSYNITPAYDNITMGNSSFISNSSNYIAASELLTLNINSTSNGYECVINPISTDMFASFGYTPSGQNYGWVGYFNTSENYQSSYGGVSNIRICGGAQYHPINPITLTDSTLSGIFDQICKRVRHANIYVNGVCWSYVGGVPTVIAPEFPDIVGGEELPITTWPLTIPKAPSFINLPGLRQAFQRAKNTDNQFDIMDLKDSLVDPDGDPITDPEMETVPIPLPNPDPINPEVVPELPDLPLIPTANNPGFSGVSVLAEIINFTNQSLPSALITVFWGIVFGAVILGIIKILHK